MKNRHSHWNIEAVKKEALKYKTRNEFQKNSKGAYLWCVRNNKLNAACSHMPKDMRIGKPAKNLKWNLDSLSKEALKYTSRSKFEHENLGAYSAALKLEIMNKICAHMTLLCRKKYSLKNIQYEAQKYSKRVDFKNYSSGAYQAAKSKKILDEVCQHMTADTTSSSMEREIAIFVSSLNLKAQKKRDRKIYIFDKPWITGFDIDIYVPKLNKGIEFDGTYYHSFEKMRKDAHKIEWPDRDIRNYHQIKDDYFKSQGIEILHIKEKDWLKDKENVSRKIYNFFKKDANYESHS